MIFESSASELEGAISTLPRGARSELEDLGNLARSREYAAANVANWYRFVASTYTWSEYSASPMSEQDQTQTMS